MRLVNETTIGRRLKMMRSDFTPRPADPPPAISVVAPCYNEEQVIDEFVRRTMQVLNELGQTYEVVLVNDGSSDATWEKMQALALQNRSLVLVDLARNHGHQLALSVGLSVSRGEAVFLLDADLQDPPELLPEMLALLHQGHDVVYGRRIMRQGESAFKKLTAHVFYRFLRSMSDIDIPTDTGDFRLMSRRAVDVFLRIPERARFVRGMVSWIGFSQVPFSYERDRRYAGTTKYPLQKMLRLSADGIMSFSTKPLGIATFVGMVFGGIGLMILVYSLISFMVFQTVPGWTSAVGATSLLGGIQLLILGIIGGYIGRIYRQVQGRPLFVIKEIQRRSSARCSKSR